MDSTFIMTPTCNLAEVMWKSCSTKIQQAKKSLPLLKSNQALVPVTVSTCSISVTVNTSSTQWQAKILVPRGRWLEVIQRRVQNWHVVKCNFASQHKEKLLERQCIWKYVCAAVIALQVCLSGSNWVDWNRFCVYIIFLNLLYKEYVLIYPGSESHFKKEK